MTVKKTIEDNSTIIVLGSFVATSVSVTALYAKFLGKQAVTYAKTSAEIVKLIAEKSPDDLIRFTEALYNVKK